MGKFGLILWYSFSSRLVFNNNEIPTSEETYCVLMYIKVTIHDY